MQRTGLFLTGAAVLFWLSWLLMPGVGVTDARQIFALVSTQRLLVVASVIMQLISAVLYVPALLGVVSEVRLGNIPAVQRWSGVLLVGAMGSAADAVLHLIAILVAVIGGLVATKGLISSRVVGLVALGIISAAQV